MTGVWQHHALTYDGTTLVWYIDGAVIGTHIYAYNTDDTVLWAGKSEGVLSGYFAGSLDDVRVYSWALSQPEVQLVHAAGRY